MLVYFWEDTCQEKQRMEDVPSYHIPFCTIPFFFLTLGKDYTYKFLS